MSCFEEDHRISKKILTLHSCWGQEYLSFRGCLHLKFGDPFEAGITEQQVSQSMAIFEASREKFQENSVELAKLCKMYARTLEALAGGDETALETFLADAGQM